MRSILARLMLVVAVALIPALTFAVYSEDQSRRLRDELMREEALRLVRLVNGQQLQILEGAEQLLTVIGNSPALQAAQPAACSGLLQAAISSVPRYVGAVAIGLDGRAICYAHSGNYHDIDLSKRPYFNAALRSAHAIVGDFTLGRVSGVPNVPVAKAFRNSAGQVAGVVALSLSADGIQKDLEQTSLPAGAAAVIVDRNGTIVARTPNPAKYVGKQILPENRLLLDGREIDVELSRSADGIVRLAGISPVAVPPVGLGLSIGLDRDAVFASLNAANRQETLLIAGGIVAALALTALLGMRLIRAPMARLLGAAQNWHRGDLTARTTLRHDASEFGALAAAFDDMASSLEVRERAKAESEARLRLALNAARLGVRECDLVTQTWSLSDEAAQIMGFEPGQPVAFATWLERIHPDDRERWLATWNGAVAGPDRQYIVDYRFSRPDGAWGWLAAYGQVICEAGRPVRVITTIQDITERKRAEEALRDGEERLRLALITANLGVRELDLMTGQAYSSPEAIEIFGRDDERDKTFDGWFARVHPDDQGYVRANWDRVLANPGEELSQEYRFRRPDGAWRWIAAHGRLMFEKGRPVRTIGVIQDITARKEIETSLRESETRLRLAQEAGRIGSWERDLVTNRMHWSDLQCRMFGVDPADKDAVTYQTWRDAVHPEDIAQAEAQLSAACADQTGSEIEYRIVTAEGVRWMNGRTQVFRNAAGEPVRMIGTVMDITERRVLEDELRILTRTLESRVQEEVAGRNAAQARAAHAERLQALGQLAGGIAHDFNNVLQAVSGALRLIARRPADEPGVLRIAQLAIEATDRGAAITRRLLAFGRRADLRAEPIDPESLLQDMREILVHTLGVEVQIRVEVQDGLHPLLADKSQLETALINLATNARDAMPEGGTLTFVAAAEVVRTDEASHPEGLTAGSFIRISVEDNGTGMDAATLARASEPFFTTKKDGAGTGLGLAMTKGFAEQSGGAMRVASGMSMGTTVTLWFPQADPKTSSTAGCTRPGGRADESAAGGHTLPRILLVDDDAAVRQVLAIELTDAGYAVTPLGGAREALSLVDAGQTFGALVTDLSMPEMDGLALIRAVQERQRGLPAVLLTGYAGDGASLAVGGALSGTFSLLRKPVSGVHLADRLAALLAERAERGG